MGVTSPILSPPSPPSPIQGEGADLASPEGEGYERSPKETSILLILGVDDARCGHQVPDQEIPGRARREAFDRRGDRSGDGGTP